MNIAPAFLILFMCLLGSAIIKLMCSGAKLFANSNASSRLSTTKIAPLFFIESYAIWCLLIFFARVIACALINLPKSIEVVIQIGIASLSCSACATRSAAHNIGFASVSAIINVSVGPYKPSIPTSPYTSFFAIVVYIPPGPHIKSTFGIVSVP